MDIYTIPWKPEFQKKSPKAIESSDTCMNLYPFGYASPESRNIMTCDDNNPKVKAVLAVGGHPNKTSTCELNPKKITIYSELQRRQNSKPTRCKNKRDSTK